MVPQSIYDDIAALSAQVQALGDLSQATRYDIGIVRNQAATLLATIDDALNAAAGNLDAGDPSGFPGDLVADLIALQSASADQASLAAMRGFVGRAVLNLAQA